MTNTIHPYISDAEAWGSPTAARNSIDNTPPPDIMSVMMYTALRLFGALRNHFKVPIIVTSFYRCKALNDIIYGASSTSQHMIGEAMDLCAIYSQGMTNKDIFNFIYKNLIFDQLIWEYGTDEEPAWVHVSISYSGNNRKEAWKHMHGVWERIKL